MADVIKLVQNDNLPEITLTLTDANSGSAIDVSDPTTSVKVRFRAVGSTTLIATLDCVNVNSGTDGKVKFWFPNNTLDVEAGAYEGEIEINFNGNKQTVYDILKFKLREDF